MRFLSLSFLFVAVLLCLPVNADDYYKYKCNSIDTAEQAKKILEEKKFFIDFCSSCPPNKAGIRRVDITAIDIEQKPCGSELLVTGKLVRGVKPPVFGGYCTDEIEVYNPSIKLEMDYKKNIDLAYTYVWSTDESKFVSLAEILSLEGQEICVKSLQLKK